MFRPNICVCVYIYTYASNFFLDSSSLIFLYVPIFFLVSFSPSPSHPSLCRRLVLYELPKADIDMATWHAPSALPVRATFLGRAVTHRWAGRYEKSPQTCCFLRSSRKGSPDCPYVPLLNLSMSMCLETKFNEMNAGHNWNVKVWFVVGYFQTFLRVLAGLMDCLNLRRKAQHSLETVMTIWSYDHGSLPHMTCVIKIHGISAIDRWTSKIWGELVVT
jgi:hypothetical protein